MKKLTIAIGALAFSAGVASAGGMVVPAEPVVAAPVPATTYDWTGAYAGLSLTYGRSRHSTPSAFTLPNAKGYGGGALIGYNWQAGNFVYGLEVAGDMTRLRGTDPCANPAWECRSRVNSVISGRVRAGVAMDTTLLFATVGLASASIRHSTTLPPNAPDTDSRRISGVMFGAGIEHALAGGWHIRGDLEHYRFSRKTFELDIPYPNVRATMNLARVSAVFRF